MRRVGNGNYKGNVARSHRNGVDSLHVGVRAAAAQLQYDGIVSVKCGTS